MSNFNINVDKRTDKWTDERKRGCLFVCVEVLRPSQPNGHVERGQFT